MTPEEPQPFFQTSAKSCNSCVFILPTSDLHLRCQDGLNCLPPSEHHTCCSSQGGLMDGTDSQTKHSPWDPQPTFLHSDISTPAFPRSRVQQTGINKTS